MKIDGVKIVRADSSHMHYAQAISEQIQESAKQRKTGIALRSPSYLQKKIESKHAVIAINELNNEIAGFCYIESWESKQYVSTSGLVVFPQYRGLGLAKRLKKTALELAISYYPQAQVFGLTTGSKVMHINNELGYRPVAFEKLTKDKTFWKGCESCVNFHILQSKDNLNCLCTGMLYDKHLKSKEVSRVKVILAFSGGLDTSFCVKYLQQEKNYEVHTITVNTGGFSEQELSEIEQQAYRLGAKSHQNIDATDDFYKKCVKYLIFGNVLKNNCYPLCVSAERAFQALVIAEKANEMGINIIAHGCTGAGNDQVRFDLMFHVLCPQVEIITPIRDKKLSRQQTQDYLIKNGIACSNERKNYSINKGLWGTSVGGSETLTSHQGLPEEAWPSKMTKALDDMMKIKISFSNGEPVAINGEKDTPVKVIQKLQQIAQPFAVGRDVHVGDTIINIKGRVGFEAAAPMILIKAHHLLEKHVLTKAQLKLKDPLAISYGEMVHEGLFIDPALRDIESFLNSSQTHVTGDVYVELRPWHFQVVGCQSDYDLMHSEYAVYGEENKAFTSNDVKGFTKVLSTQLTIHKQKMAKYE